MKQIKKYFLLRRDFILVGVVVALLLYADHRGYTNIYKDVAKYQCYAGIFLYGSDASHTFPRDQCAFLQKIAPAISQDTIIASMKQYHFPDELIRFVAAQSSIQPLHALPKEYPLFALLSFLIAFPGPTSWYQFVYALWMAAIFVAMYFLLLRSRSARAARVLGLYLLIGSWGVAFHRFDLIPSALTLCALICATRFRWNWAFSLLALAVLAKFYALVLIPPFLLAQQMQTKTVWYSWQRWRPSLSFMGICIVFVGVSLLLSVEGTLAPFTYFGARPVQIESSPASVIWLISRIMRLPLDFVYTYGSENMLSFLSEPVGLCFDILLGLGFLFTLWMQWRKKIDLSMSCLLLLLIVVSTGKVFSPQYLIWLSPLVALVGEDDYLWVIFWLVIGGLTTWIYPFIYESVHSLRDVPLLPIFYPLVTTRNVILLLFVIVLLISSARRKPPEERAPLAAELQKQNEMVVSLTLETP